MGTETRLMNVVSELILMTTDRSFEEEANNIIMQVGDILTCCEDYSKKYLDDTYPVLCFIVPLWYNGNTLTKQEAVRYLSNKLTMELEMIENQFCFTTRKHIDSCKCEDCGLGMSYDAFRDMQADDLNDRFKTEGF